MMARVITPFRRGGVWWARVPRIGRTAIQRSLGVADKRQAELVCHYLQWLVLTREAWLLDELAEGRVRVTDAYTAYVERTHERFVADARAGNSDPDLVPHLDGWQQELARRGSPAPRQREKYLRQVQTLLGDGPFRRSELTRSTIRAWLAGLDVTSPNRYRSALSSFCNYLVEEEVLPLNPVHQVRAAREAEPRRRHLSMAEVTAFLAAIPGDRERAANALMLATAIEFGVARQLRYRDLLPAPTSETVAAVYAAGTKRVHRHRTCVVYGRWRAVWAHVEAYVKANPGVPAARLFGDMTAYQLYISVKQAAAAVGIADYRPHDHRHTWAVRAVQDGLPIQAVSHQLGHRDAVMTLRVYGVFTPSGADFRGRSATTTATVAWEDVG
jgi:integrase